MASRLSALLVCLALGHMSSAKKVDPVKQLKGIVTELAQQVQTQQFAMELKTRMDGGSGIVQQEAGILGPKPWHTDTHTGFKFARFHDHADHINTVGMGQSVFVLNGVEFKTRHNDYPVYMAHPTSSAYNAVKKIPFPDVPPEVANKATLKEQIAEMKLWFKAWKDQDPSVRDYTKYFKPVLCYLEGGWHVATNKLEEAFFSDRHFVDALTFTELQEKIRFNAFIGRKNLLENYAYLPKKIFNITEDGVPQYAQWNYRILCHQPSVDIPFKYLVQEDDLQARFKFRQTMDQFKMLRGARFRLQGTEGRQATYTLLDKLMREIPGRDNYQGYLTETSLGDRYMEVNTKNKTLLNVAYYYRGYKNDKKDASGGTQGHVTFSDPNIFIAQTTQPKIAPKYVRMCTLKGKNKCWETEKRVTYAVPLEIIYLTPLHNWNPYNLSHVDTVGHHTYTNGGKRTGGFTKATAFTSTQNNKYYTTPTEFFGSGKVEQAGPADTAAPSIGILDPEGKVRRVSASGFRIFLPEIEGVGTMRTRWPIMPVHGEASPVWKELNALKDIVMNLQANERYLYKALPRSSGSGSGKPKQLKAILMKTSPAYKSRDKHTHIIKLSARQRSRLLYDQGPVHLNTTLDSGHSHEIVMQMVNKSIRITSIDGKPPPSADGHGSYGYYVMTIFTDGSSKRQ